MVALGKPFRFPIRSAHFLCSLYKAHSDSTLMSTPRNLYHYTSKESLQAIKDSNTLYGSSGPGDCALGEGVYFTSKPPQTGNTNLLKNNYDDGGSRHLPTDRVQSYIRFDASR